MSAPPEVGLLLPDALAVAAHRMLGPLVEANEARGLDIAAHLMVERITADGELMVALMTIRGLRYEGRE